MQRKLCPTILRNAVHNLQQLRDTMKKDGRCSFLRKAILSDRADYDLDPHKLEVVSRKRRRPGQYHFGATCIATTAAALPTATDTTAMIPRRKTSWQPILAAIFFAIEVVSVSSSGITVAGDLHHKRDGVVVEHHHQHVIDHESEAIWQALDDESASLFFFEKRSILSLWTKSEENQDRHRQQQQADKPQIQETTTSRTSSLRKPSHRSLQAEGRERERDRKDHNVAEFHFPATTEERHRILIVCDEDQSQEDCLSKLLGMYDTPTEDRNNNSGHRRPIEVIHNLESIHGISVQVDTQTLGNLVMDHEFVFHNDFVRGPLVVEGSMGYYHPPSNDKNRNLQDAQEVPWGLDAIRAQDVWQEFDVRGEGVKICILDTGIQASHEDFRESDLDGYYGNEFVSPHWYEDNKGHGTHIAGTITASDNSIGIV